MLPELASTPLFGVSLTVGVYVIAEKLHARARTPWLHPVPTSIAAIVVALTAMRVPYESYASGGKLLLFLLGPSVVALAVPLHVERRRVAERALPIGVGIVAGAVTSVLTACGTAKMLGASRAVVLSLAPKSVTTPIAIGISERIGGIPSLTACVVVLTGCLGALAGPEICRALGVRDPVAVGLAVGTACHGIGTARMLEVDRLGGAVAGLAIGLNGLATSMLIPVVLSVIAP